MEAKNSCFGRGMDKMPGDRYKYVVSWFVLFDFIRGLISYFSSRLNQFGIEKGFSVIDYGCGPGGYLKAAAKIVGENGKVYAVDVQPLAIEVVKKKIDRYNLLNIVPVLAEGYSCGLQDETADVIYAMDMFHMVKSPTDFLTECHRLLKKDGHLILDDGHQPRSDTRQNITDSKLWKIVEESNDHLKCKPV